MIAAAGRLLRVLLGGASPSIVYTVRRSDPLPRSWLARQERAVALRHIGPGPTPAELREAATLAELDYIAVAGAFVRRP